MKTTLIAGVLAIALAFLAGCAAPQSSGGTNPNAPGRVELLFSKPAMPYTELGAVSTLKVQPDRADTWQNVLKRQAALMSADAVIVDTSTLNNVNTPMVMGTAIKYKPQSTQ